MDTMSGDPIQRAFLKRHGNGESQDDQARRQKRPSTGRPQASQHEPLNLNRPSKKPSPFITPTQVSQSARDLPTHHVAHQPLLRIVVKRDNQPVNHFQEQPSNISALVTQDENKARQRSIANQKNRQELLIQIR